MGWALVLGFISIAQADLVVLDNGAIRVEIDPRLFAVRYVGPPGGPNLVLPLYVEDSLRNGEAEADPGGVVTRVLPFAPTEPAIVRGPAEVIDRREHYVALLGAVSKDAQLRIKKEFTMHPRLPKLTYRVTVLSLSHTPRRVAVQSAVNLNPGTTLHGMDPGTELLNGDTALTLLHAPQSPALGRSEWFGRFDRVEQLFREVAWHRKSVNGRDASRDYPGGAAFRALLDNEAHTYAAVLQGPYAPVDASSPLTFSEEWELSIEEAEERGE